MYQIVLFYAVILVILHLCDSARILGIIPTPSYSHQIVYRPIWKELSLKGHKVTVLTTDPMKDPSLNNLTEIDLHSIYDVWNNKVSPLLAVKDFRNPITFLNKFFAIISEVIDLELQHPKVQQLIKNESEHFDLVMVEFMSPTMFAFAERFKCPSIAMLSLDASPIVYGLFGNPVHPVLNPDLILPFGNELTFPERLISVLYNHVSYYMSMHSVYREELIVKNHFGGNFPPLEKIVAKTSLLFVNANPIFHRIRPLVPAIIPIGGGIHLQPSKPLPKDLKKILDGASQGFIYFSLGSNVKSKNLPERSRQILLQVFGKLPYTILWKFELENLPDKPDNVIISKWFPQQDIFGSRNRKQECLYTNIQELRSVLHLPTRRFQGSALTPAESWNLTEFEAKLCLAARSSRADGILLQGKIQRPLTIQPVGVYMRVRPLLVLVDAPRTSKIRTLGYSYVGVNFRPNIFGLEHPHLKLFITQGGLQSMEEAILNNVPLIGMPFFGDQPTNVNVIVSKGFGLSLDPENLNKDVLRKTILEVIENSKYRNRVKEAAKLALDQPMTGLERAVWWTEYVLRHKGAEHLRSPALDIPSYQYYLLDVIGFCLLIVLIALYLLLKCICKVMRYLIAPKPKEKVQ